MWDSHSFKTHLRDINFTQEHIENYKNTELKKTTILTDGFLKSS